MNLKDLAAASGLSLDVAIVTTGVRSKKKAKRDKARNFFATGIIIIIVIGALGTVPKDFVK